MSPGKICQAEPSCNLTTWLWECSRIRMTELSRKPVVRPAGMGGRACRASRGGIGRFVPRKAVGGGVFAAEPIRGVRQRAPRGLHPPVAAEGRLVGGGFGELRAILGVVAKDI